MDRIQSEWEALAALRRRVRGIYLVHMLVYVLVLVLMLFKVMIPAVVLGVLNMLVSLLYVRRRAVAYSNEATRLNLLLGLCAPLQQAQCTGKNGMTQTDFTALQLLPTGRSKGDGLMCHNSVMGSGFGLTLRCFEATMAYPCKGKNDRTMFRYLNGTILTAEQLPAGHTRGDWLLLRRGLLPDDTRRLFAETCGYHLVEAGDAPEDELYIYTHGDAAAMPSHLRHHLTLLTQAAADVSAIRLTGDSAAVYLENQFYTVTIPLHYLPEPRQLTANPLPQRDAVWELFRYWAKVD